MKLKRIVMCVLSVIMLFSVITPAGAISGSTNVHTPLYNGVRSYCIGSISAATQSMSIQLHFVTGEEHLPESDYYCSVAMKFTREDGYYVTYGMNSQTMSASLVKHYDISSYVQADLEYKVMTHVVHSVTIN